MKINSELSSTTEDIKTSQSIPDASNINLSLLGGFRRTLDSAYAETPSGDKLDRTRTTLFGWARTQLTGPVGQSLETYDWRWFAQSPLNNAVVIAQRLYRMDLNLFDEIYLQSNADIAETIRAIQIRVFTQADRDPYRALYSRPGMRVED